METETDRKTVALETERMTDWKKTERQKDKWGQRGKDSDKKTKRRGGDSLTDSQTETDRQKEDQRHTNTNMKVDMESE